MGQFSVILTLSAILLGAVLLYNARASTGEASGELGAYQTDRIAREAAQIGLRKAARRLNDRPEEWTDVLATAQARFNIPLTTYEMDDITATYQVDVTQMYLGDPNNSADPDIVKLTVTGGYDGWNPAVESVATTDFVLKATYERGWVDIGVPPERRKVIQTDENLDNQGNGCISGGIHANGTLSASGGAFDVLGSGTYTGGWDGDNLNLYTGGVVKVEPVDIPIEPIPPASYTYAYTPPAGGGGGGGNGGGGNGGGGNGGGGNGLTTFLLSGTNDPAGLLSGGWFPLDPAIPVTDAGHGVAGDPYVLYIDGNLEIDGNVRLLGYSQIYVRGTILINDNATLMPVNAPRLTDPPYNLSANMLCKDRMAIVKQWTEDHLDANPHPDSVEVRTKMALYAGGNVTVKGTPLIVADIVTNAAFSYSGGGGVGRLLIGGVTSQNDITLNGATMIYYTEADENTQPRGNRNVPNGLRLVSYREWAQRVEQPTVVY